MKLAVMVLSVEVIPFAVLVGAVHASPLRRRPRFGIRFAAVVVAMLLPDLVAVVAAVGEDLAGMLVMLGFVWGLLLIAASRFVLFHGEDPDARPDEDDGNGPGPEDDGRPTPPAPTGGIPLLDADPSPKRVREHHPPQRTLRPRRRGRERERVPSRLWPLWPWPSWRPS